MLWSTLCRFLSRIFWLLGVIYDFLFHRKSPSDDKKPRFPLLKLDYVAIREVLNTLDPIDYIHFSKASKSCRRLSTIKKPYKVKIHFAEFPLIRFCTSPIQYFVKWTANREEDGSRDFWEYQSHDILYKYSENRTDVLKEFKEYYLYVKSLMSVEVDSVVWHMGDFNQLCRNNVDWLRSNGPEFPALSVHGSNQQQEELQYILDNLKFTKSLKIVASMIDSIENPLPLRIPDTLEELSIFHGPWITLDYIMSLKMRRLEFYHTYLTNENLNVFFKSWIEMKSHHNLERLEINLTNREDFIVIGLRDIPYRMGPMRPAPSPTYVPLQGSFEVTRKDGLTASICAYRFSSDFVFIMYTQFFDLNEQF